MYKNKSFFIILFVGIMLFVLLLFSLAKAERFEIYDIERGSYITGNIDRHGNGHSYDIDRGSYSEIKSYRYRDDHKTHHNNEIKSSYKYNRYNNHRNNNK